MFHCFYKCRRLSVEYRGILQNVAPDSPVLWLPRLCGIFCYWQADYFSYGKMHSNAFTVSCLSTLTVSLPCLVGNQLRYSSIIEAGSIFKLFQCHRVSGVVNTRYSSVQYDRL